MTLDVELHLTDKTAREPAEENSFLYKEWLKIKKEQGGYFLLANNILQYLPLLKNSAAMNLYLYYTEVARNQGGFSWHSISRIAKELHTSERTINNWNNVLQKAGLILRVSGAKSSYVTQLLPLEDFLLNVDHLKINKVEDHLSDAKFKFQTSICVYIKYLNQDHKTIFTQKKYSTYALECCDIKEKDSFSFNRYVVLEETFQGKPELFKEKKLKKDVLYWNDDNDKGNSLTFLCNLSKEDELGYEKALRLALQLTRKGLISEYKKIYKEKKITL